MRSRTFASVRTPSSAAATAFALTAVGTASILFAPTAHADMTTGNYEMRVSGRYDFHTWIWAVSASHCESTPGCRFVSAIPMPVAKAFPYTGEAQRTGGRYTLTVDVPDGLRCGNVYYGPVLATRDTYSWDAMTLQGTLESVFPVGCDGSPGGALSYPIALVLM